jgi:hypothetical protein
MTTTTHHHQYAIGLSKEDHGELDHHQHDDTITADTTATTASSDCFRDHFSPEF